MTPFDVAQTSRVIVMLGSGGVGKTTTSILMATLAAQAGKRVALLSIDPAKRLAAALGIPLGNELVPIKWPEGVRLEGRVDAAMLDQKAVFDSMVRRHAPSEKVVDRILENQIYKAASTNLSGPLEYMALAKLQELAENPEYDVIVLDTPPDSHALDFLARPNILAGFMENKVMSWLIKPFMVAGKLGMGKLMSVGERLMGGVAKVTGVNALHAFADFLVLMQEVIEGFHQAGERIKDLLGQDSSRFVTVSVATPPARRSALSIVRQLNAQKFRCDLLIFNRSLPDSVTESLDSVLHTDAGRLLAERFKSEQQIRHQLKRELTTLFNEPPAMAVLSEHDGDLDDPSELVELAAKLRNATLA